jgi:glycerate dehydrogenase
MNIPAYSTQSVAELVFAYLLDWARGVGGHSRSVHSGSWSESEDFTFQCSPQRELSESTLGLIGFGEIAQAVTQLATAFRMKVLATTPHPEGKPDLGQTFVPIEELLAQSDLLSLHCPLTPETDQFMDGARLEMMKKGSVLINTARGGLLDEDALQSALDSGHLAAAYLDVLSSEPPPEDHILIGAGSAVITPHLAWATQAARQRLIHTLVQNVDAWLEGTPQNVVNGV